MIKLLFMDANMTHCIDTGEYESESKMLVNSESGDESGMNLDESVFANNYETYQR